MHKVSPNFNINVKGNVATFNFNKDYKMDGKVYADTRASCGCGKNNFTLKINMGSFSVPYCSFCHSPPDRFRISAYYPDASSKSGKRKTDDIRHDDQGRRITTPDIAVYMLRQIEKEISDGYFNPDKYTSQSNRQKFKISFIAGLYLDWTKTRSDTHGNGEITDITFRKKKGDVKKWIIPFFGELDVQHLDHRVIKQIYNTNITANKKRVLEELNNVLKFAKDELIYNFNFPLLPKGPQKKFINENEVPDISALYKIAQFSDNPIGTKIFKICGLYLIRPSDVVTMKRSDLDLENGLITITSHQSGSSDIDGRKSDKKKRSVSTHTLPIGQDLMNLLAENADSYNPLNIKGYLFVNKKGDSFLPYSSLNKIWIRARKKAAEFYNDKGLLKVELYRAAKHAGVTKLLELGYSDEKILRITGIGKEALKHYARLKAKDILEAVDTLANLRDISSKKMGVTSAHKEIGKIENLHTSCTQDQSSVATYNHLKKQGL